MTEAGTRVAAYSKFSLPDNPPALAHRTMTWGQKAITQYTLKHKCDTIDVCVAESFQS